MSKHSITAPPIEVETATAEWQRTTPEKFSSDAYREGLDRSRLSARSGDPAESHRDSQDLEEDTMSREPIATIPTEDEVIDLVPPTEEVVDLTPPAQEEPPVVEDDAVGGEISSPSTVNAEDLAAVRELILTLHPAIVPELIDGDSIAALIASVIPAQEAYNRIVANVRVPAGGNPVAVVDVDAMSTYEKIRRGLKTHPSCVP